MAFSPISPLSIKSLCVSSSNSNVPNPTPSVSTSFATINQIGSSQRKVHFVEDYSEATQSVAISESKKWSKVVSTAVLAAAILTSGPNMAALADLNKFEAATRGEFGIGSAAQFGSADLRKAVHVNENFR